MEKLTILSWSFQDGFAASPHLEKDSVRASAKKMGCSVHGRTLGWPSAKKAAQQLRDDGIAVKEHTKIIAPGDANPSLQQLISLWQRTKDRDNDPFLWGDEVCVKRAPFMER